MNWKDKLQFEVMEDYLMCAEMGHWAVGVKAHKAEMREHWQKLQDFIQSTLREELEEITKSGTLIKGGFAPYAQAFKEDVYVIPAGTLQERIKELK